MSRQRKRESAECTARVALDAVTGLKTVNACARIDGVHPTQIMPGQHQLHSGGAPACLGAPGQAGARPRGVPRARIPTQWATQGGGGLGEKKS